MVAEIWEEVFGIAQIGLHDNFYELGGESLMATRIVSRIRDTFQVDLAIRSLLENPTVAGISRAIEEAQSSSVERQEPVIMSVSREAYRAKRSPEGEIEIPEIVRSQEDKLRRR
jgi:acyl carrier protein